MQANEPHAERQAESRRDTLLMVGSSPSASSAATTLREAQRRAAAKCQPVLRERLAGARTTGGPGSVACMPVIRRDQASSPRLQQLAWA